jgi:hypothetical protein
MHAAVHEPLPCCLYILVAAVEPGVVAVIVAFLPWQAIRSFRVACKPQVLQQESSCKQHITRHGTQTMHHWTCE